MTLSEAIALFIEEARRAPAPPDLPDGLDSLSHALHFFAAAEARCGVATLADLTPETIRDFLSSGYIEAAAPWTVGEQKAPRLGPSPFLARSSTPEVHVLIAALAAFVNWAGHRMGHRPFDALIQEMPEIEGMLVHALRLGSALTVEAANNRGAFGFPEFLTSFEEGGQSQYDLDTPGAVGAIDGYFRILRVSGCELEAVEMITEQTVKPIIVSPAAALLCAAGYIVNLELVRAGDGWRIVDCGFAYPPGFRGQ